MFCELSRAAAHNGMRAARLHFFIMLFMLIYANTLSAQTQHDAELQSFLSFADPAEIWGPGIEAVLEQAYRECFKTFVAGGQVMTLRMPFAQNNERAELAQTDLIVEGQGKAYPQHLWNAVDSVFKSSDFAAYVAALNDGREKVIIFDLPNKTWALRHDFGEIARMKAGSYSGLPHRPYVFSNGSGAKPSDVYNYLFCVSRIGMDCSGFVWYALSSIAEAAGLDFNATFRKSMGIAKSVHPSLYAGAAFFDSKHAQIIRISDTIKNLKAGDIIIFRGDKGEAVHSAIIQSIDWQKGVIRYVQSTDEAPTDERGVHESYIYFNPSEEHASLKDERIVWTQKRCAAFQGEKASSFSNDGARYRAYPAYGGGFIVRLRIIDEARRRLAAQ